MTERHTDELLDAAIDSVARELMQGAPSAGFASRVRRSCLPEMGPGPKTRSWRPRLYWAAATAAAILVIALMLPATGPNVSPGAPRLTSGPEPTIRPPAPQITEAGPPARAPGPPTPTARRRPGAEPVRVPIEQGPAPIAALEEIADLAVTVNQPASLTLTDLDMPDLAVAPLDPDRLEQELP
jgi:hypothetical protein